VTPLKATNRFTSLTIIGMTKIMCNKEDNSVRGSSPGWKDTFYIDDKGGEIHQMQRTKAWFQGEKWSQRCIRQRHVSKGSMSDMTSVLHGIISVLHESFSINAKGGYC
jgi:hypothetical protein